MRRNILIIEDDPITTKILCTILEKHGFTYTKAMNGSDALAQLSRSDVNGVLLDLNLPDINGLEILKQVRNHPSLGSIAVLIVTDNDDKLEAVLGLEMGADDYITKPFFERELVARLNSVLRRTQQKAPSLTSALLFGDLQIDIRRRLVTVLGQTINLSFKEFEILILLASNPGVVLTREGIMDVIGGLSYSPETRTVDMHISSIRRKLNDTGKVKKYIDTISSVGYRFRK